MYSEEKLNEFFKKMKGRLKAGHEEYGEDSFMKHNVPKEIEEEILDICAWSFLLYEKLQRLKAKL